MDLLKFSMAHKVAERLEVRRDLGVDRWQINSKHRIADLSIEWQQWDSTHNKWVIQDVQLIAASNQMKAKSLLTVDTMAKEHLTADQEVRQMLLWIQN